MKPFESESEEPKYLAEPNFSILYGNQLSRPFDEYRQDRLMRARERLSPEGDARERKYEAKLHYKDDIDKQFELEMMESVNPDINLRRDPFTWRTSDAFNEERARRLKEHRIRARKLDDLKEQQRIQEFRRQQGGIFNHFKNWWEGPPVYDYFGKGMNNIIGKGNTTKRFRRASAVALAPRGSVALAPGGGPAPLAPGGGPVAPAVPGIASNLEYQMEKAKNEKELMLELDAAHQLGLLNSTIPKMDEFKLKKQKLDKINEMNSRFDGAVARNGLFCPRYLRYQTRYPPTFAAVRSRKDLQRNLEVFKKRQISANLLNLIEGDYKEKMEPGTEYLITLTKKENEISPGKLEMIFSPPLTFKSPSKMGIKILSAGFPNTFYNISEKKKNNLMGFDIVANEESDWTRIQCKLPDGNYSIEQLMWIFFKMQLEAKIVDCLEDPLTNEKSNFVFPVHWHLNEANTFSTFVLRRSSKIQRVKLQLSWWGGLEKILGFTDEESNEIPLIVETAGDDFILSVSSISPNRLFDKVGRFSILCPLSTSAFGNKRTSDVLYSDIFVGAQNTLQIYPSTGNTTPLLPLDADSINSLELTVVNEIDGEPIDFHDEDYFITIVFVTAKSSKTKGFY